MAASFLPLRQVKPAPAFSGEQDDTLILCVQRILASGLVENGAAFEKLAASKRRIISGSGFRTDGVAHALTYLQVVAP
jgi:hypothetical protein